MTRSKTKEADYLYLSARLSARETKMLSRDKMSRMIEADSFGEAARALYECGYEDMSKMKAAEMEKALINYLEAAFSEIEPLLPEKGILDAFRLKYDYHNAKVLIKSESADVEYEHLMSGLGRLSAKKLEEAYQSEEKGDIPEKLAEAVFEARGVLMRTESPRLSDFVLDKAYFAELLSIASKLSTSFLLEYAKLEIDAVNLSAIVRTQRSGGSLSQIEKALIPGGNIDILEVMDKLSSGEPLSKLYQDSPYEKAAQLGEEAAHEGSITQFEQALKSIAGSFAEKAGSQIFGANPVIGYITALENEVSAVRVILRAKLAGLKPAGIRERLGGLNV